MEELKKARKQAIGLIETSDEFVVLTSQGQKTYCTKLLLLSMLTSYLSVQKRKGTIKENDIDLISKLAKASEEEIIEEVAKAINSKEDFMNFIKFMAEQR